MTMLRIPYETEQFPPNTIPGTTSSLMKIDDFAMIRWRGATLARDGIPDLDYPVPRAVVENLIQNQGQSEGTLDYADMLRWMQDYAELCPDGWDGREAAALRLAELILPADQDAPDALSTAQWYLQLGEVDLGATIVTVQRGEQLLAAVRPDGEGRVVAAIYRPLDHHAARLLTGCAQRPGPDGSVCLRPNAWEYTLDQSAAMGQVYASCAGGSYLSFWELGLGLSRDRTIIAPWHAQRSLEPLPARTAAGLLMCLAYDPLS